jgi:hypothetical protein
VNRSKAAAFDAVTEPGQQIELLIDAMFDVVNDLLRTGTDVTDWVKVVLVDVENNVPCRFRVHLPNNTVPSAGMLEPGVVKKTSWARAIQLEKPIIIEDIAAHLSSKGPRDKKYLGSAEADGDRGSLAAIPIRHPQSGQFIFVLSFKSPVPHKITEELIAKDLRPILTAIQNRLLLEYNIELIKRFTQ